MANITGSDPYWYHIKRQLTTQANQEGLKGAVFFTVSVEDYHWRNMMRLIYVPNGADITTRIKSVRSNTHIVDCYFFHCAE